MNFVGKQHKLQQAILRCLPDALTLNPWMDNLTGWRLIVRKENTWKYQTRSMISLKLMGSSWQHLRVVGMGKIFLARIDCLWDVSVPDKAYHEYCSIDTSSWYWTWLCPGSCSHHHRFAAKLADRMDPLHMWTHKELCGGFGWDIHWPLGTLQLLHPDWLEPQTHGQKAGFRLKGWHANNSKFVRDRIRAKPT